MSIRQRLLLWLLSAVCIAIAVAGVSVYHRARVEANQLFDYQLKQIALTLQDHVFGESNVMGSLEEEIDYDFVIQVWTEAGVKRYFSHPHKALPPRTYPGYETVKTDEGQWRVFSMAAGGLFIQTAQPAEIHAAMRQLEEQAAQWRECARRGLAQAERFSWVATAKQTLAFYERILSAV